MTPLSSSRDYLSIGEVLESVRDEFPEVSISKIRFLENEGLLTPQRTGSGYRKFYDDDVARLRYVLSLQRDQFLPLKVIKERLEEAGGNGADMSAAPLVAPFEGRSAASNPASSVETPAAEDVQLSRAELAREAGLSDQEVQGLEEFGILSGREPYGGDELAAARAARGLFSFGVEPRHLRMYRQASDREASLLSQIVSPLQRKRDVKGQEEADRSLGELLEHSRALREALLSSSLRFSV